MTQKKFADYTKGIDFIDVCITVEFGEKAIDRVMRADQG